MTDAPVRRRLSPDQRRDQLVAATVDVLADVGYQATTAEEIASRAGVSKGLLWHYFTDLDDLFDTTARQTLLVLRSAVAATLDLSEPAPRVIRAAIHGAAGLRLTHGAQRRAIAEIVVNLRTPAGDLRFGLDDYDETYARQAEIFARGQSEGDFDAGLDPLLMAVTYQGAVDSMLGYLDAHPATDGHRHADQVADMLLRGIGKSA
ncbi:TetR family transcriptional regulator [Williamsia maris]|uniref:Transcriptional regulator, TetR family n=1 Tax=Williamsia maris TaxID=72806 RepID=A0ABT1HCR6_9NOCA|nr:TetR/AcrR family transcriptional regulator [Williamsia maris]MCP2176054.1 transcriptional regulator, TetR family [Williamsia maris]